MKIMMAIMIAFFWMPLEPYGFGWAMCVAAWIALAIRFAVADVRLWRLQKVTHG